jgi:hypothetical protein
VPISLILGQQSNLFRGTFLELNPTARRFARALLRAFPQFSENLDATVDGHFETYVRAPTGSKAGVLACSTTGDGDVWIRFSPPGFFYPIDTEKELVRVVGALLRDEALFVRLRKRGQLSGGTLVNVGDKPAMEPGETARILSWSGRHDAALTASKATNSKAVRSTARSTRPVIASSKADKGRPKRAMKR